jgi:hypothetical protein
MVLGVNPLMLQLERAHVANAAIAAGRGKEASDRPWPTRRLEASSHSSHRLAALAREAGPRLQCQPRAEPSPGAVGNASPPFLMSRLSRAGKRRGTRSASVPV